MCACVCYPAPTGFQASGYSFHSHEWRNAKVSRGSVSPGSGRQKSTILQDLGLSDDEWDKPTASGYLAIYSYAHTANKLFAT